MTISQYIFPVIALLFVGRWIFLNHEITGIWGLYDTRGTQFYNQFVAQTKLIPPNNHPSVLRMRSLLPPGTDIRVPYWVIQEKLARSLDFVWADIDKVLFDVAWASVTTHPVQYTVHSIGNFARLHYSHIPHWRNLGNLGREDVYYTDVPYCETLGSATMCKPLIITPWSYSLWNTVVGLEMKFFTFSAGPVFYILIVPSLVYLLLFGKAITRFYAGVYVMSVIPIALTIHADPRYIVPFYPLIVLIVITAGVGMVKAIRQRYSSYTKLQKDK